MSSSLALAQRAATKARATLDTMTRQIATGQKVSSVKDDSAAWTRAAGLRSQQAQIQGRETIISLIEVTVRNHEAVNEASIKVVEGLRELIIAARAHQPGSAARAALAADYAGLIGQGNDIRFLPEGIVSDGSGGYNGFGTTADPILAGQFFHSWHGLGVGGVGWLSVLAGGNLNTASSVNLDTLQADADSRLSGLRDRAGWSARSADFVDWARKASTSESTQLDTALGSLTDADMGKASTARSNAETRQQLALSTIQQAISAYGNFAGGLLGNVQQTQRGLMA